MRGESPTYQGVSGWSHDNACAVGKSQTFHAVFGISHDPNNAGVFGTNDVGNGSGFGVAGSSATNASVAGDSVSGTAVRGISQTGTGAHGRGGRLAGLFEGDVEVTGAEGELRPGLSHSNKARVACRPAITSLKRRPPMAPPSTTMSVPLTNDDSSLAR